MTTQIEILRAISIAKMFMLMDQGRSVGGDWDDQLAADVDMIPDKMDGIKPEEMAVIQEAYSCPRAASEMLETLVEDYERITGKEL